MTLLTAAIVAAPLVAILLSFLQPTGDVWYHLSETLLPELLANTALLATLVGLMSLILGVSTAWITATCEFPGRRFFSWALLLPLAIPTYVLAFAALGLFDYAGPLQTAARAWFGNDVWVPQIRSAPGVAMVMSLALYPYVYLLARSAFLTQGTRALEAAQSLGLRPIAGFFRVALPMARPWIAGGVLLVLMETLADFGAVSIFNYDTFTTGIYKAWFGFFSLPAAAQLSSILVLFALVLVIAEQRMRKRMRFHQAGKNSAAAPNCRLRGAKKWGAALFCALIFLFAFAVPVGQLVVWAAQAFHEEFGARYWGYLLHSFSLAGSAMALVTGVSLLLAYAERRHRDPLTTWGVRFSTLGYALPGTVLAVGIFIPVAGLDNFLIDRAQNWLGMELRGVLKGTVGVMLIAYLCRFLSVGFQSVSSAMQRVTASLDEAARLAGHRGLGLLRRVYLPLLRGGMTTGAILVFIDVMKEMPITLMTRPFGWDTLSVKIFELTSEGEWERAALPALTLVLAGLLPVALMVRHSEKGNSR